MENLGFISVYAMLHIFPIITKLYTQSSNKDSHLLDGSDSMILVNLASPAKKKRVKLIINSQPTG